jgi:peptide-methionine (S)-S-oxide reductase
MRLIQFPGHRDMSRLPLIASAAVIAGLAAGAAFAGQTRTAIFAGGCYWSMEHDIKAVKGVVHVTSGFVPYAANAPADPGVRAPRHYESVKVEYDPTRISYAALVARYLRMTDPTDAGGQFCDRGPAYRTAIFTSDPAETQAARAAIAAAQPIVRKPIVTRVLPFNGFHAAPADQQDWARKNFARYSLYRQGCGKDRIVAAVWGGR